MTRKEELETRAEQLASRFVQDGQSQAEWEIAEALLQVEQEVWEKAVQRPYTVHTNHHSQDYCEGYVRASEDYANWCREQRKEVDG